MAFTDPQSVTVNAIANSVPRISQDARSTTYQSADGLWKLVLSHQDSNQKGRKRVRTLVRFEQRALVTDPVTSVTDYDSLVFSCIIDRPQFGFTVAQVQQLVAGLQTWMSGATVAKLYGLET